MRVVLAWILDATLSSTKRRNQDVRKAYDTLSPCSCRKYTVLLSCLYGVPCLAGRGWIGWCEHLVSSPDQSHHRWTRSRMVSILQASQFQALGRFVTQEHSTLADDDIWILRAVVLATGAQKLILVSIYVVPLLCYLARRLYAHDAEPLPYCHCKH